ncbi:MAG: hypothetical protein DWQ07_08060 [Chloroflexi bacterium]|nr:MAG: hypothetical protein DWQ07_08060 [Chloroflexota bacterium]MBL1197008.1 hypothetical protein [Chloroflexota bacterium]NOH14303.1 hypothetical protein [Chloroflexota bacterium]
MPIEASSERFETRFGQIFAGALAEVVGQPQANALIKEAGLPELEDSLPDFDSDLQFSFNSLKRILLVMKQSYPQRSAQGITQRTGEASFSPALRAFGPDLGLTNSSFQLLPLRRKLPEAVAAITALLNELGLSKASFLQNEEYVQLSVTDCSLEDKEADSLAHFFTGLLRAALYWVSGGKNFHLQAAKTFTMDEDVCQIHIPLKPAA